MNELIIPDENILLKILEIRGQKVMMDSDLAILYQVNTKRLNEQVKRNLERFPDDFMFQLTIDEWERLKSQIATSRSDPPTGWGGRRTLPYVFTEQGIAMLSSVLNSDVAIQVNIQIIRVFTKMREVILTHKDVLLKVDEMERKLSGQDEKIGVIFDYLKQFIKKQDQPREKIGY